MRVVRITQEEEPDYGTDTLFNGSNPDVPGASGAGPYATTMPTGEYSAGIVVGRWSDVGHVHSAYARRFVQTGEPFAASPEKRQPGDLWVDSDAPTWDGVAARTAKSVKVWDGEEWLVIG